ncbi:HAD domain-containing protein [Dactylosporangium sp. NPDC000521]|uniref:HAD domain-containing protein n=1 Tax=Dactylosporangium sp. NPDC000521 TaxID=3363975 RepID=UPI00369FE5F7
MLFLDVDGPLLPFGGSSSLSSADAGNPLLARLDPAHGTWLGALPCELVWATTWMDDANEVVAPLLGLPALPVVDFPGEDPPGRVHWKTPGLVAFAAGRPFAWLDDEIGAADRDWVATHHPAPALLHAVDARHGLTRDDVSTVAAWLRHLSP